MGVAHRQQADARHQVPQDDACLAPHCPKANAVLARVVRRCDYRGVGWNAYPQ